MSAPRWDETNDEDAGEVASDASVWYGQAWHDLRERHTGSRVLLAEDNLVNQEVALELLASAGLDVTVVDNGADAVARAIVDPST